MKVAILTQPLGHNYGGLLQAFALQQMLIELGHDPETIDRQRHRTESELFKIRVRSYFKFISGKSRLFPRTSVRKEVFRNLVMFKSSMLKLSPAIPTTSQLCDYFAEQKFDAVVVGSDQVWRPEYSPELGNFFLDFLDIINSPARRISYAASFGVDTWEYSAEETLHCAQLIQNFDRVSVREKSAVTLCEHYLGTVADWVLDPTLCITKDQYLALINSTDASTGKNAIFEYVLDSSTEKTAIRDRVADLLNMRPFSIMPKSSLSTQTSRHIADYIYPPVSTWLQSFRDAEYIITDSFHGCVFSLIFNKPFIAIANKGRGTSRFESLLSLFGLESRLIESERQLTSATLSSPIDWDKINNIRVEQANQSRIFLEDSLTMMSPSTSANK